MTASTPQDAAAAPAALTAFLRGVERRGAVFAQLLAGDQADGDEALSIAMHAFRRLAARSPFADWPRRFWSQLLASPTLRQPPRTPAWAPEFDWLAGLGHGPRAALLLRLVAGLSEADAAAVLGIARPTYRLALQRALPHHEDRTPDVDAWRALGDTAQAMVRGLPAERLAHLAHEREDAIHPGNRRRSPPSPADAPRRWRRPALAAVAIATVLALAATFWPGFRGIGGTAPEGIRSEPLPPAGAPAARYAPEAALATHGDLELLLAADEAEVAGDGAVASDPAFHAWYAAQGVKGDDAIDDVPPPAPVHDRPETDDARSETDDAP